MRGVTPALAAKLIADHGHTGVGVRMPDAPAIEPATEKEFMAEVVAYAKRHGWRVYHTHNSRRSEPGFPDLVMIRDELLIAAELKRSGKERPTADQETWLEAFAGVRHVESRLWRPGDWPEIEGMLSGAHREAGL